MPRPVNVASVRLATLVILATLPFAHSLDAQRRGNARNATAASHPAENPAAIRAEYAAVLLQSRKYDEAAREYRALVAQEPSNIDYRLGLARALAWGNKPREAEAQLRMLQTAAQPKQAPAGSNTYGSLGAAVDSLLQMVREAMDPKSWEAAAWVVERTNYAPYRLALARALAREHYPWMAAVQYDTLLAGGMDGKTLAPIDLRRERTDAFLDNGEVAAGAAGLRDLLRYVPTDTAARHRLAGLLVEALSNAEARAQYDTLVTSAPTADLFMERARLRLDMNDHSGAEGDLLAALQLNGPLSAYTMLADMYRERGDYDAARSMFRAALSRRIVTRSERIGIAAAIAQMTREERPVAYAPAVGEDAGWSISTDGVGDNLGVHFASSTLRAAGALGDVARVGISAIHQYLGERSPTRSVDLNSYGGEGSLASQLSYGPFLAQLAASGGVIRPAAAKWIPLGTATVATWIDAWELALERSIGPAYPSLLTTTAIRSDASADADVITERSTTGVLGGPLGPADVAMTAQQSRLSDSNRRLTVQGMLRLPFAPAISAVYSGYYVSFAERSTRYWDPLAYIANGIGLEFADRELRGFSWAVRALPGMAWSRQLPPPALRDIPKSGLLPGVIDQSAFVLNASGELRWRGPGWETTAAASYGLGRVGDYRRVGVTLGARVLE